ncbi:hypothetical protein PRZ48_001686 [Zasmidium cellare]|uniref:Amidase domain-containing protein n=1 Tax=Zasmidium cellare TaxID=395010 RepID=A0ABR0F3N1_ZASCE|nr:hypothetical protein PRZ48_001686 [Zasmidium cellare]
MMATIRRLFVASLQLSTAVATTQWRDNGGGVFKLGDISYFTNKTSSSASLKLAGNWSNHNGHVTVLQTNSSTITADDIQGILHRYLEEDDVFDIGFAELVLFKTIPGAVVHSSALDHLATAGSTRAVVVEQHCTISSHKDIRGARYNGTFDLPPGPYYSTSKDGSTIRDSAIPVPSKIYSWSDPRPFAGFRVAVKDIYDMKGLVTTGGSRAWGLINPAANATAPAIQRIVDLGGVLVGKFKLAQFASGADPWMWQDEHPPFNPRGDGWLSCSASSSGGGCAVAAYDWLDFAIGSDTDESMRLPAAVSGTYAQRPSQGIISLEGVLPGGAAMDTAGVFARDPQKWVQFSKHWYTPALHQSTNITGLVPLEIPDTNAFPKTILYPIDYLPLNNTAAQPILDDFISKVSSLFGMHVKRFNFTATVAAANVSDPLISNLTYLNRDMLDVLSTVTQYEAVGRPLLSRWAELFDGRFPPIDSARRQFWHTYNHTRYSPSAYNTALRQRRAAVDWYSTHLQYPTAGSCSESLLIYDIGPGGLPSYREEALNNNDNATFLDLTQEGAKMPGSSICPIFGCVDFVVPIGQVGYWSEVTFKEEMVPVTVDLVVRRGCDFVLYNLVERLAEEGMLKGIRAGRKAF